MNGKRKFKLSHKSAYSLSFEDDDIEFQEVSSAERPIGRKAAKEVIKRAKNSENEVTKRCLQLLEELKVKRLENELKREELFSLELATKKKRIDLMKRELAIETRIQDAKIMAIDTSKMSPLQAEYFTSRQKEILAKSAQSCDPSVDGFRAGVERSLE